MKSRSKLWLSAWIIYCLAGNVALAQNSSAVKQASIIEIGITTHLGDRQTFVEGDVISFLLSLDSSAFVYLFYQDASRDIYQILPNRQSWDHYYEKGFYIPIPRSETDFQFKIQPPFGEESLFVFATDNARVKLRGRWLENGLRLIDGSADKLETSIRQQSKVQYGAATMLIKSQAR